jgi:hypothetical protein
MKLPHTFLLAAGLAALLLGAETADIFTGNEALFVARMQDVFMIKDGSTIVDPSDAVIVAALRKEVQSLLPGYSMLHDLGDLRNASLVSDGDLGTLLMLAIMGNFHRKSVTNADVYDDVQIVFDPSSGSFVTLQNLRDTEITVFKALLVISVGGLLLIFMLERNRGGDHPAAPEKKENAALHLGSGVHDSPFGLYNYPIRLRH